MKISFIACTKFTSIINYNNYNYNLLLRLILNSQVWISLHTVIPDTIASNCYYCYHCYY